MDKTECVILKNKVDIYHTGYDLLDFSVFSLYHASFALFLKLLNNKYVFLFANWCQYSLQRTCSPPKSLHFYVSLSIIFEMDSFLSIIHKNGYLHALFRIVYNFFKFLPLYKIKNKKKDYVTEMFQTWIKASLYFLGWDALNGNS